MSRPARSAEKTREKILDAAIRLFTKEGCEVTTMDDLARSIHISKRTLYETYDNKAHLLNDCCCRIGDNITKSIEKMSKETSDRLFFFMFCIKTSALVDVRYHKLIQDLHDHYPDLYNKHFVFDCFMDKQQLSAILQQGIKNGDIVTHINVDEFTRILSLLGKMALIVYPNSLKLQKVFVDVYGFTLIRGILSPAALLRFDQPDKAASSSTFKQHILKYILPFGYTGEEYICNIINDTNNEMLQAGRDAETNSKPSMSKNAGAKVAEASSCFAQAPVNAKKLTIHEKYTARQKMLASQNSNKTKPIHGGAGKAKPVQTSPDKTTNEN